MMVVVVVGYTASGDQGDKTIQSCTYHEEVFVVSVA